MHEQECMAATDVIVHNPSVFVFVRESIVNTRAHGSKQESLLHKTHRDREKSAIANCSDRRGNMADELNSEN